MNKFNNIYSSLTIFLFLVSINIFGGGSQKFTSNDNFVYLSPVPNSKLNSSQTNIIIRSNSGINKSSVKRNILSVKGSISGIHSGKIILADDYKSLLFNPDYPFSNGESIIVNLSNGLENLQGNQLGSVSFEFDIANKPSLDYKSVIDQELSVASTQKTNFKIEKLLSQSNYLHQETGFLPATFPSISLYSTKPSDGQIFLSDFSNEAYYADKDFLLILNNDGSPFFYKKTNGYSFGLTLQPNGKITYFNAGTKYFFFVMDSTFQIVDSVKCGNGYQTDVHELRILPNNHYLLIGGEIQTIDMSKIVDGGNPEAKVTGIIIQELDSNKNVIFQWRSWDHYKITDAVGVDLTAAKIDYVHANAVELDNDGNIIISSRHLDEVTKINRTTGDIIWRWGGKNNQFTFINDDVGFSHQHAVRRISNGNITLFDNGNLHVSVLPSRALEYKLDEKKMTAELVWQYINQPTEISSAMGYVQRLNNGNTLIGWGTSNPAVTEVTPSNEKVFEMSLPDNVWSYRAFRFTLPIQYYSSFVPNKMRPESGTISTETTVHLSWNKNLFANSFHVQVAKDSNFSNLVSDVDGIRDSSITLKSLETGQDYFWHVAANNNNDLVGGYSGYSATNNFSVLDVTEIKGAQIPSTFSLMQNYPNPFNPNTKINYTLPRSAQVRLIIYDMLGRQVSKLVDEIQSAGYYTQQFNAGNLSSGIYIYQLQAYDSGSKSSQIFQFTRKMLLVK